MDAEKSLALQAYETWDTYGGRRLDPWPADFTQEAWLEVVKTIRAAIEKENANVVIRDGYH